MNKEKYIYGISAGILVVLIIGIIGWISVQEIQKGKEENQQVSQQERGRSTRSIENENSARSETQVGSVTEADTTLEEMDRLANELEQGEEASE